MLDPDGTTVAAKVQDGGFLVAGGDLEFLER
jgi:hypothetical protein